MIRNLVFIVPGIIVSILDLRITKLTSWGKKIIHTICMMLGLNVFSLSFFYFIVGESNIFSSERYMSLFSVEYVAFTLLLGAIYLFLKLVIKQILVFKETNESVTLKQKKQGVLLLVFFIVGSFLLIATLAVKSFFGELTPEQFIFNFHSPIKGTSVDMRVIITPVLAWLLLLSVFVFFYSLKVTVFWKEKKLFTGQQVKRVLSIFSIVIFVSGIIFFIVGLQLPKVARAYFDNSSYIENNYVSPDSVNLSFPQEKRNLIHFYLESYENTYFDQANGGYMDTNLMPDLLELSKEGIHFSHNELFGGPHQTYGSSWSVAGMVNMSAGLPLKIPTERNAYGSSGYFLPGAVTIGDILQKEGYEQTVMFGADADFGGLTAYFTSHGDFKLFDVKYAREEGLIPQDYNVWWGYEDNKLYEFAKEELIRLSESGKPFNFVMENADTHFPDGFLEPETETLFDSQYANVIYHSQKQVVDFIRWIQQQPFYENTTIVLTGDHLSMDKNFFKEVDPKYHRTTFNLILNADFSSSDIRTTNRVFAPFDMFPTILSSIGVQIEGDRLALGTDLSSMTETILERDGVDFFNNELSKNSRFYNKEFVAE